jgi:hypothetical protein
MMHFISHWLGLDNASGAVYLFWSGFFGDLALFGGAWAIYHKHNCHYPGCPRIGKHVVDGTPYCTRHHPEGR